MKYDLIIGTIPLIGMLLFMTWIVNDIYTTNNEQIEIWNTLNLSDCEISNIDLNKWKSENGTAEEKAQSCITFINEHRSDAIKVLESFNLMIFPGMPIIAVILFVVIFGILMWPQRSKSNENEKNENTN